VSGTDGATSPEPFAASPARPEIPLQRAGGSPAPPADAAPSPAAAPGPRRPRDQYIDGLRALALVRVMTYHTFGWIWLPVAFPSMGVMFALGGSLVAGSLSSSSRTQAQVLRKRLKRLLPPLWLYGAVVVAVMARHGWTFTETAGAPLADGVVVDPPARRPAG